MTETPKRLVHWQLDTPSLSNLNSPFFNTIHESSIDSTSSLEFINAQLVAHGYVPAPGLSLDGISNEGYTRVVKCLLALLSQRMEDMSRTEELTTKVRTLTYDHERMVSMHRKAKEESASAEREMNLHKASRYFGGQRASEWRSHHLQEDQAEQKKPKPASPSAPSGWDVPDDENGGWGETDNAVDPWWATDETKPADDPWAQSEKNRTDHWADSVDKQPADPWVTETAATDAETAVGHVNDFEIESSSDEAQGH